MNTLGPSLNSARLEVDMQVVRYVFAKCSTAIVGSGARNLTQTENKLSHKGSKNP